MNNLFFWATLCCVLLVAACGTSKRATKATKIKEATPQAILDRLVRQQVQAEWMDARANVDLDSESMRVGGTLLVKARKDSIIWLSVKKFGFEVARAQISQDSVYILDRINKEYAAEPLSYLEQRYQLPARFELLQQLLFGNPVFFSRSFELEADEQHYILKGSSSNWTSAYFVQPNSFRLDRMELAQTANQQRLDVLLEDYQEAPGKGKEFSYLRRLLIDSEETGEAQIELAFTKVEFDAPTEIRFEVPSRYERNKD